MNESDPSDARGKTVFSAMERILDGNLENEASLITLVRPFSSQEYLQAVEERSLAGRCGNPVCNGRTDGKQPLKRAFAYHDVEDTDGSLFCSSECEGPVRRLAAMLGSSEAAMLRFTSQSSSRAGERHGEALRRPSSQYAAGGKKTPIMLSEVVERSFPAAEPPQMEGVGNEGASAVEGYLPQNRGRSTGTKSGKRVRFAEAGTQADDTGASPPKVGGLSDSARLGPESEDAAQSSGCTSDEEASEHMSSGEEGDADHHSAQQSDSEDVAEAFQEDGDEGATQSYDSSFPWYDDAPATGATMLTLYGQLHIALDELISDHAAQYCRGEGAAPACDLDDRQAQILQALQHMVDAGLSSAMIQRLCLPPRPALNAVLQRFLRLLNLNAALPSLKAAGWTVLVVIFLKGLSMGPNPELQPSFEGREAVRKVSEYLSGLGIGYDEFESLLELLC